MFFKRRPPTMVSKEAALPGRSTPITVDPSHVVTNNALQPPFPAHLETTVVAMGCFWGAERLFWQLPGVWSTAVGYAAGHTPNPTYQEVCSGQTGHTEVVLIVFDPEIISYEALLRAFWQGHNPTHGMRQGNDVGTQYRSGLYPTTEAQATAAAASQTSYQEQLTAAGHGAITTEIIPSPVFYYAETYHQQYLFKNPNGYCGLGGTGVSCAIGLST